MPRRCLARVCPVDLMSMVDGRINRDVKGRRRNCSTNLSICLIASVLPMEKIFSGQSSTSEPFTPLVLLSPSNLNCTLSLASRGLQAGIGEFGWVRPISTATDEDGGVILDLFSGRSQSSHYTLDLESAPSISSPCSSSSPTSTSSRSLISRQSVTRLSWFE